MKRKTFLMLLPAILCLTSGALATELEWEAGGTYHLYEDSGFTTKLVTGDMVQLILDVSGDGLDGITWNANWSRYQTEGLPTGDDILLPLLSGTNVGSIGDGMPAFDKTGHFFLTAEYDEMLYFGSSVYVVFYDSSAPAAGDQFWHSESFTLTDDFFPVNFNIVASGNLYTKGIIVPEPATWATLGFFGILLFWAWRKQPGKLD